MEKLNNIEKRLKEVSREELNAVVDGFLFSMEQIGKKYGSDHYYHFIGSTTFGQTEEFSVHGEHDFRLVLRRLVEKKFLGNMVNQKSKELIEKLDLL